ncbi:hypothetical protein J6590_017009 [Homalodisca vitripennis]|nr:hypothetical protein J6590_017009 [Homalodisca vitripennis]
MTEIEGCERRGWVRVFTRRVRETTLRAARSLPLDKAYCCPQADNRLVTLRCVVQSTISATPDYLVKSRGGPLRELEVGYYLERCFSFFARSALDDLTDLRSAKYRSETPRPGQCLVRHASASFRFHDSSEKRTHRHVTSMKNEAHLHVQQKIPVEDPLNTQPMAVALLTAVTSTSTQHSSLFKWNGMKLADTVRPGLVEWRVALIVADMSERHRSPTLQTRDVRNPRHLQPYIVTSHR